MPTISSSNNAIIPLRGVGASADPTRGLLLCQGNSQGLDDTAWPTSGIAYITTFYWVYREPLQGTLNFCFQVYLPDGTYPSTPSPLVIEWMYLPNTTIHFADYCAASLGGTVPNSFQYGPSSNRFVFNFDAGFPAGGLSKMMFIRTNATQYMLKGAKIDSNLNSGAPEGYGGGWASNLVLPAPLSNRFTVRP